MGLSNCRECGKLFLENSFGICPDCIKKQEQEELKVVAYLRDVVSQASVLEIHEATGVKERVIMKMIRQGRIVSDVTISYPCETCGTLITQGRLCDACNHNITAQVEEHEKRQAYEALEKENKHGIRMYSKGGIADNGKGKKK